jgi:site-specific DNA recombinase
MRSDPVHVGSAGIRDELWRRAQTRREAGLHPDISPDQRLLLPLVLSLARLAARQDAVTGGWSAVSLFNQSAMPGPGARAAISARFSDNRQNPLGADDQIKVLREDCERLGWQVVGVYKDEGKSGRSIKKRTGYLDMMASAAAGEIDVICVYHLDRLGRDARELHDARNRLDDCNVVIFTHDRGVMSRFEFAMYAEIAQMESEKIGQRSTRGRLAAAQRGRVMGDIPYGYHLVDKLDQNGEPVLNSRGVPVREVAIDPVTSKHVLRANLDFYGGLSPHQIAVALTKEGVPTPQGGPIWHPNTIVGTSRSMCGLLRNPIIVGQTIHGKFKMERDPRTGEMKKRKADSADMIVHERPDLRIVPQEVWDHNQERLALRPASKLRDRRRPSYPLSGLVKCGVCGGSYVQVSTTMGCSAHRLKACTNSRRVARHDLEQAVFDGLTQRLRAPEIIAWFIPEYIAERGPAITESSERRALAVQKLAVINDEINSIREQLRLQPGPNARKMFNDELEVLVGDQQRFRREVARPPVVTATELNTDFIIQRLNALLLDLGGALNGDERDAARAKEIVRSLITKVTIAPYDGRDGRPDGKGSKGVRVDIEGEVSRLVDRATLERKIMQGRGAGDIHDLRVATFQFYVDLYRPETPEEEQLRRDVGLIGRMLDDADWPILFQEMIDALNDRGRMPDEAEREVDETRARIALAQYKRGKWVRAVRLSNTHGWVWTDRQMTDLEWRDRYERRSEFTPPIGIIRLSAPEAAVVQIRPGKKDPSD